MTVELTATVAQDGSLITTTDVAAYARIIPGVGVEDDAGDIHELPEREEDRADVVADILSAQDDQRITRGMVLACWRSLSG